MKGWCLVVVKKLPIVLDAAIISECWTFAKLAIIQTTEYANAWLASHMNLYVNMINAYFGDYQSFHDPIYYEDILTIHEIDIFNLNENQLTELIKQNIDNQKYILIYTDWNFTGDGVPRFHEILIYGYNDIKKVFYAPTLTNRKFTETEISYKHIKDSLPVLINHLKLNKWKRLGLSITYQLLLSSISTREDYSPDRCAYTALKKIKDEINGKQIKLEELNENLDICNERINYTGISCLHSLLKTLQRMINLEELPNWYQGLTSMLKKIHEHRELIHLSMNYIVRKWDIDKPEIFQLVAQYQIYCERTKKWYLMALKYELVQNCSLLERIAYEVPIAYKEEKAVLQSFDSFCTAWYSDNYERVI